MSASCDDEAAAQWICHDLVPPVLLSSPGAWRIAGGDEGDDKSTLERVQRQVDRNAAAVLDWVERHAPAQLQSLSNWLKANERQGVSLRSKALIVVTASRFIDIRRPSAITKKEKYSLSEWTSEERTLWTSPRNVRLAQEILRSPLLSTDSVISHNRLPFHIHLDIVDYILHFYLRPLFSTTNSASINESTGRARKEGSVLKSRVVMEEEVIWKGGDVERGRSIQILQGESVVTQTLDGSTMVLHHAGLGVESVLLMCCHSIDGHAKAVESTGTDLWSDKWTQILPPLLQLLQDPSPRFRLAGTRILSQTLLSGFDEPVRRRRLSSLLLRTGVATLFRQTLEASMTFLSHRIAGALLQSTAEAWFRLTMITTDAEGSDGGRERYDQWSQLIDQGVLRVWAYAPTSVTSYDLEEVAAGEQYDNVSADEQCEANNVIEASIDIVLRLSQDDAMGVGAVRYFLVMFDYFKGQLEAVERALERKQFTKPTMNTHSSSAALPHLSLQIRSAKALVALVRCGRDCPDIRQRCGAYMTVVARCWLPLSKVKQEWPDRLRLQKQLTELVAQCVDLDPTTTRQMLRLMVDQMPREMGELADPFL